MGKSKEKEYLSEEEFQSHVSYIHEHTYLLIGACLFLIGALSFMIEIPVRYITSFSIAGFVFTFVDIKSQFEKNTKKDLFDIYFLTLLGFFCLIGLPIILTQFPSLEMSFTQFAEHLTLIGVAFVLMAINFNRYKSKEKITVNKEEWEEYQKFVEQVKVKQTITEVQPTNDISLKNEV